MSQNTYKVRGGRGIDPILSLSSQHPARLECSHLNKNNKLNISHIYKFLIRIINNTRSGSNYC